MLCDDNVGSHEVEAGRGASEFVNSHFARVITLRVFSLEF